MGLTGICRFLSHRLFEAVIAIVLLTFMPNLPPFTSISEPFKVTPAKPFEGKLALNEKLDKVEIWHKGELIGPEAFADYNGELYTGLATGEVVKLVGNHITPIVQLGKPCRSAHEERICGRPLGLEFDSNGNLYVADAYYGIFKVNVQTGKKELIVSPKEEIEGKKSKLFNSLTVASNGDIFWTTSSTEFLLEDGVLDTLVDGSGRLVHYDSKTNKNKVLIDKLHFANGVALSEDEEFILIAETSKGRIHRYYLKGPNKGARDIFIDGLPGVPDNIKSLGKDGFLVPLVMPVDSDHPSPIFMLGPFPLIRKFVARCMAVPEFIISYINNAYPNDYCEKAVHFIGHFTSIAGLFPPHRTTILHVSKSGEILNSLHTTKGKVNSISEAHIFKGNLYLGSPWNDYVARIPAAEVNLNNLKVRQLRPVETPTPKPTPKPATTTTPRPTTTTTTTPKPTTTTPRPTTTTPKPTTTTPRPTTTTPRPTTTTTTPRPATTTTRTPRPATTTTRPAVVPKVQTAPPPVRQPPPPANSQEAPRVQPTTTPKPTPKPTVAATPKPAQQKVTQPTPQAKAPVKENQQGDNK